MTMTATATAPATSRTDQQNARAELDADYTPRFVQVARAVRARIKDGTYPRFSLVPGSRQLAAEFGVSQIVALHGLTVLVRAGYLRHVESKPHQVIWSEATDAAGAEGQA
jgi:DNA-binding transcriptional regulator YhcF (GntR family)